MRKTTLSSLALMCALGSSAVAADLPARPLEARSPAQVVAFSWSGLYVGANAGYGFGKLSNTTGTASSNLNGPIAGGQIGGNWQTGMFVLGLEGDFQGSWQKRSTTGTLGGLAVTVTQEMPWFATARARAGVAFDRSLVYATGGAAWVGAKISATAAGLTVSSTDSQIGWTIGGGWEYAFADRWSAKVEYLYLDTGNTSVTLFNTVLNGRLQDNIVRAGVNYHF